MKQGVKATARPNYYHKFEYGDLIIFTGETFILPSGNTAYFFESVEKDMVQLIRDEDFELIEE